MAKRPSSQTAHRGTNRFPISFRIGVDLKNQMNEAAKASGRSIAGEAEMRIERSFHDQQLLIEAMRMMWGDETAGFMLELGDIVSAIARYRHFVLQLGDTPAFEHPWRYQKIAEAIAEVIERHRPAGEVTDPGLPLAVVSIDPRLLQTEEQQAHLRGIVEHETARERDIGRVLARQRLGTVTHTAHATIGATGQVGADAPQKKRRA